MVLFYLKFNINIPLDATNVTLYLFSCYCLYIDVCLVIFYIIIFINTWIVCTYILFRIRAYFDENNLDEDLIKLCQHWLWFVMHVKCGNTLNSSRVSTWFFLTFFELVYKFILLSQGLFLTNTRLIEEWDYFEKVYTILQFLFLYPLLIAYDKIEKMVRRICPWIITKNFIWIDFRAIQQYRIFTNKVIQFLI